MPTQDARNAERGQRTRQELACLLGNEAPARAGLPGRRPEGAAALRRRWRRSPLLLGAVGTLVVVLAAVGFFVASWFLPFPLHRLDRWPVSPRVTDRTGRDILAVTGRDQQWRFPIRLDRVSPWLIQATIAVEDERFYSHHGVDPLALARAAWQDVAAGRIVSGGSTLTMQVCRMMDDQPRTWHAKVREMFRSLQLERLRDKPSILETYLNIAPYGRNLRGVQAAAWTWFGKPADELSLAEAALLAGLPQSPSRYRPDHFPDRARARRDTVLRRMVELGMITPDQRDLAAAQPVLVERRRQPLEASHAGWLALQRRPAGGRTTIDPRLQTDLQRLVSEHLRDLPARTDVAAVILDIPTGEILALLGSADPANPAAGQVDGATARRSPGSALKPFIYAAAFEGRRLAPDSIVFDMPIYRDGWMPANFDRAFHGPLTAADALRRSVNIPAILVAQGTGLPRCLGLMQAAGVNLPAGVLSRSGLSVAVGGAEVRLLDLVSAYATLGRGGTWLQPRLFLDEPILSRPAIEPNVCATLDDILSSRQRRPGGMDKLAPHDVPWFMWKTGTSSGRRDAWAVGHNRKVAIGVWVGRFNGLGDAELTGARSAEPLLARLFDLPALRSDADPPQARPLLVNEPLPPPPERIEPLHIASPRAGSTFIAIGGTAVVRPRLSRPADVTWFLNGQALTARDDPRLALTPGRYELRCVNPAGDASAVKFAVR